MTKRYFRNELQHSKRFDHVPDDVTSLFWIGHEKNYQVELSFLQTFSAVR